ncbi:hypothetical protein OROGR_029610 [Orobanche gracilis]
MTTGGVNLDRFFEDVEAIKDELSKLEALYNKLQAAHDRSKTLHNSKSVKDLRSVMDDDVSAALRKAKLIKVRLEALDRSNAANRTVSGCGPGSSSDRTRTSIVNGLRKKLHDSMTGFNELRQKMSSDLIETGKSETFLQKAIQEQGRGQVMDTIVEIQERYDAVKEMERNLMELHQVFLDMAVLVQSQGERLDDIESQVNRASSFVRGGTQQLEVARKHQKNTRKWACFGILILLIVVLIIVLSLRPWRNDNNNNNGGNNRGQNQGGGSPLPP